MSRPDPDMTNAPKAADYFDPKPDSNEAHRMKGLAIMRRGQHRRLVFAIGKLEMIDDPFDSELATLGVARKELVAVEKLMVAAGQTP